MSSSLDFASQEDLLDFLDNDRPVTFLVGSAISASNESTVPGVPLVPGVVELIRNEFKNKPEQLQRLDEKIQVEASNKYSAAFKHLLNVRSPDDANRIVRTAVLQARLPCATSADELRAAERGDTSVCKRIESDIRGWSTPPAVEYLGRLVAQHKHRFGPFVLTTNFDPLIEVSVHKAGSRAYSIPLQNDGELHAFDESQIGVVHLHGHWALSDTLHDPAQLLQPRPRLRASIARLLANRIVVVVGYGGWNDTFTKTLVDVANDRDAKIDVRWCFYSTDRYKINNENDVLFSSMAPGIGRARIRFYCGVNAHSLFPALCNKLGTTLHSPPVHKSQAGSITNILPQETDIDSSSRAEKESNPSDESPPHLPESSRRDPQ